MHGRMADTVLAYSCGIMSCLVNRRIVRLELWDTKPRGEWDPQSIVGLPTRVTFRTRRA